MSEERIVDLGVKRRRLPVAGAELDLRALRGEARALARELDLERPVSRLADAPRRARAHATAVHNYAINRRLAREGREDLRPLYFIWTLSRTCNFLCDYCDDHQGRRYPELPTEGELDTARGLRLLDVMRTGTSSVYFAGGEPLLRNDLPLLASHARAVSYYPIIVNTNASALDRRLRQAAWRGFLADIDILVVSLDALDPSVLSEMWGYARPEEVIRNLLLAKELAAEMNVKLMVNTVIQPGRVQHARAVLDFARELGITFSPVPVNVGPRAHRALTDDPEYLALARTILARKREGQRIAGSRRMLRRLLFSEPLDCRNTLKPHVDHDGHLFWPCKASVAVEPARIDVLSFNDVDSLYAHGSTLIDPTRFSERCGATCNWAQNYSTDAYAHGLTHPLSLASDVIELLR